LYCLEVYSNYFTTRIVFLTRIRVFGIYTTVCTFLEKMQMFQCFLEYVIDLKSDVLVKFCSCLQISILKSSFYLWNLYCSSREFSLLEVANICGFFLFPCNLGIVLSAILYFLNVFVRLHTTKSGWFVLCWGWCSCVWC